VKRRSEDYGKRGEQTRKKILDAAFRLIGTEKGLRIRIEEICAGVPISRPAFYHYFLGLEELFEALSLELSHDFNQAVFNAIAGMRTGVERTDAGMRYYLEKARRDPAWGWAMVHISANGPLFGAGTAEATLATIQGAIATGELDLQDALLGRDLLQGTVLAAMSTQLKGSTSDRYPKMVSRYVLRAFGVPAKVIDVVVARTLPDLDMTAAAMPAALQGASAPADGASIDFGPAHGGPTPFARPR